MWVRVSDSSTYSCECSWQSCWYFRTSTEFLASEACWGSGLAVRVVPGDGASAASPTTGGPIAALGTPKIDRPGSLDTANAAGLFLFVPSVFCGSLVVCSGCVATWTMVLPLGFLAAVYPAKTVSSLWTSYLSKPTFMPRTMASVSAFSCILLTSFSNAPAASSGVRFWVGMRRKLQRRLSCIWIFMLGRDAEDCLPSFRACSSSSL